LLGAGPVGLLLAALLQSLKGFDVHLYEKRNEYIHPAAIMVLSPQGRIARYLYGIEYHPKTVRLSLVEAGEGKIGSSIDQLVLYCFHYDAKEGSYAPVAMNIMRVSSGVGATLFGFLTSFSSQSLAEKEAASLRSERRPLRAPHHDEPRHVSPFAAFAAFAPAGRQRPARRIAVFLASGQRLRKPPPSTSIRSSTTSCGRAS
jgi:hypothetical protein